MVCDDPPVVAAYGLCHADGVLVRWEAPPSLARTAVLVEDAREALELVRRRVGPARLVWVNGAARA